MWKSSSSSGAFECRFTADSIAITLTREGMPAQTFEARLEHRRGEANEPAAFACGFTIFIERNSEPTAVVAQLLKKLHAICPIEMTDADVQRLRDVSTSWVMFNFRPVLEQDSLAGKISAAHKKMSNKSDT